MQKPDLLDYAAAAAYLGLSEFTLRRYVSLGLIGRLKLGPKLVRFTPEILNRFIAARAVEPIVREAVAR